MNVSNIGPITSIVETWEAAQGKTVSRVDNEHGYLVMRFTDGSALLLMESYDDDDVWPTPVTAFGRESDAVFFGLVDAAAYEAKMAAQQRDAELRERARQHAEYVRLRGIYEPQAYMAVGPKIIVE